MEKLYSTGEAAEILGKARNTVLRNAIRLNLGVLAGRCRGLTKGDIEKLRKAIRSGPGNPNFAPGNYFGKPASVPIKRAKKRRKKS